MRAVEAPPQGRWPGVASVGVVPAEEGFDDDFDVEAEGPVLEIEEVVGDSFLDTGVAPEAVHLGPARDAGFVEMAPHVAFDLVLELFDIMGAFGARADNAHVSGKDIEELREFVQVPFAEEGPDGGAAGIVGACPAGALEFGVGAHGAELDHAERSALFSAAFLEIEDRARGGDFDGEGAEEKERGAEKEGKAAEHDVEGPLGEAGPDSVQRPIAQAHDGNPFEVADLDLGGQEAEEVGDEVEREVALFAEEGDVQEEGPGDGGVRDDNVVGGKFGKVFLDGGGIFAPQFEGDGGVPFEGRLGANDADHLCLEKFVGLDGATEALGGVVGAEEQHTVQERGVADFVEFDAVEEVAFEEEEEGYGEEGECEGDAAEGRVEPERVFQGEIEDEREEDGAQDAGNFVFKAPLMGASVEFKGSEDQEEDRGGDEDQAVLFIEGRLAFGRVDGEPVGVEAEIDSEPESRDDGEGIGEDSEEAGEEVCGSFAAVHGGGLASGAGFTSTGRLARKEG